PVFPTFRPRKLNGTLGFASVIKTVVACDRRARRVALVRFGLTIFFRASALNTDWHNRCPYFARATAALKALVYPIFAPRLNQGFTQRPCFDTLGCYAEGLQRAANAGAGRDLHVLTQLRGGCHAWICVTNVFGTFAASAAKRTAALCTTKRGIG